MSQFGLLELERLLLQKSLRPLMLTLDHGSLKTLLKKLHLKLESNMEVPLVPPIVTNSLLSQTLMDSSSVVLHSNQNSKTSLKPATTIIKHECLFKNHFLQKIKKN